MTRPSPDCSVTTLPGSTPTPARHIRADQCEDVVSETFLHAWRRREGLPADPLPWLLVTARHVIANRTRGERRAESLWRQAVHHYWSAPAPTPPDEAVADREAMIGALATCSPAEREALLLIAWDGLSYADAAAVLGCSERALTVRVSRGRARLSRHLNPAAKPPDLRTPRLTLLKDTP